ncbi:Heterokaryon incompatibility protein 6 OR allele [Lachnellula suecica]|uniref:Heterokaryon incompatibility protein 6 OR allele n=1 Tax=Lachnellula suecica TaxID=602035 RepID=A0A8T9CGZ8_9HELO|nr:Heterokaryon incompatibility protein 6 OR allele [Lachnellula suecica]
MSDTRALSTFSFAEQCPIPETGRSIRLVYIEIDSVDETVRIKLERHEISSPSTPSYVALSYAWGDETAKKDVWCDGAAIKVTENLYGALQRLRNIADVNGTSSNPSFKGPFWIDAICIDQSNTNEKTSQVRLMGHIYTKAEIVLVWLGEENHEQIEVLFDALENGIEIQENTQLSKLNTLQNMFKEVLDPRIPVHENLLASVLGDTLPLLLDMMPGQAPMDEPSKEEQRAFEDPEQDGTLEGDNKYRLIADIKAIPIMTKSVRVQYGGRTLGTLLPYLRQCKSSDPRDKIFGVLGVASNIGKLDADYSKTVAEVYAQATLAIIHESGSLSILSHMDEGYRSSKLPSWVPDWSIPLQPSREARLQEMEDAKHSASSDLKAKIINTPDPLKLSLQGVLVDEIETILHGELGDDIHPQTMRILIRNGSKITAGEFKTIFDSVSWVLQQLAQVRGLSGIYRSTWEPIELAYICTILAGHIAQGYKYTEDESEKGMPDYTSIRKPTEIEDLYFQADETIQRLMGEASIQTQGKRVARTRTGYLALVPRAAQKGDQIVVLKGGPMPFVLRPSGKEYHLLGDCYVHGIMKGDAVQRTNGQDPAGELFTLI